LYLSFPAYLRNAPQVELFQAIEQGDEECLIPGLDDAMQVNATDRHNRAPIFLAAQRGNAEIMEALIVRSADTAVRKFLSENLLMIAAQWRFRNCVHDVESRSKCGCARWLRRKYLIWERVQMLS
ncbi:MAG: hypothetical protein KDK27_20655, partial [Leptospiraceae bacterium]|nr:hypothetical protein [Leptospiraceae bacterium]